MFLRLIKHRTGIIFFAMLTVLSAVCFCVSGRAMADDSAPIRLEADGSEPVRVEADGSDDGAGSGVDIGSGSRSGWYFADSKAKYYDPATHRPYRNGKYEIGGRTIRFDRNGYALNYASVGEGKMFRTIKAAVKALIEQNPAIASSPANETIAYVDIFGGTYREGVNLQKLAGGKKRSASGIYFKGIGSVIWKSSADYPTGCLCGYGAITVENISFYADSKGSDPAYAYHYEAGNVRFPLSNPGVVFKRCSFRSAGNFAVGIGMGKKNSKVIFRNCTFTGARGGIYLHNSVYEGSKDNLLGFSGCSAGLVYIFDAARWYADGISKLDLRFVNNEFRRLYLDCGNTGKNAGRAYRYIPKNYDNFDIVSSGGNLNKVFDRKGK